MLSDLASGLKRIDAGPIGGLLAFGKAKLLAMPGSDSEHSLDSEGSMMLGSGYYQPAGHQPTAIESAERADELAKEYKKHVHPVWALDQSTTPTARTSMGLEPESIYLQYDSERSPVHSNHTLHHHPISFQDAYDMSNHDMNSGSIFDHVDNMQDGDFSEIDLQAQLSATLPPLNNIRQEMPHPIKQTPSSEALGDMDVQDRMPTNPRYKTKIACVHCAKNKLGCDLRRPCQRCQDTGKAVTCVDRPHVRRRARPHDRHRRHDRPAVSSSVDDAVDELDRGAVIRQSRTPYSRPEGHHHHNIRYHLPTVQSAPAQLDQLDFGPAFQLYGTRFDPNE